MRVRMSEEIVALRRLYAQLSTWRRYQLLLTSLSTIVGAVSEIATIGAVIPFIGVLTDPSRVLSHSYVRPLGGAVGSDPKQFALIATLVFVATAVVAAVVRVVVLWISTRFVYAVGKDFSIAIYRKMLFKPFSYHLDHNSSDVVASISKIQALTGGLILPLVLAFSATVICLCIAACLLVVSPVISLSAFGGFGLVYTFFGWAMRGRLNSNSAIVTRAYSLQVKALQESLGAIRDVILDRNQNVYLENFQKTEDAFRRAQATNNLIAASPRYVIEAAGMIIIAAIIYALVATGHPLAAALPSLGALVLGAQRMLPSMQTAYYGLVQISANFGILHDVLEMLEAPAAEEPDGATPPVPFTEQIRLEAVGFRYGTAASPVLVDVALTIPKGAKVGLIGRTGCGKSTLMDLVMGLMSPTSGTIRIDDAALDATSLPGWRRQVAHVPQAIFLIDGSIRHNIALGIKPQLIDETRVMNAARMACLSEFVDALPDGYDTMVGERGVRLSGGQRQRIGIARALYKRASVLVFDEATSALDERTEREIIASLSALSRDLTIFIIAHRLTTIADCDIVCRLEAGRIVESGSFGEVVTRAAERAPTYSID